MTFNTWIGRKEKVYIYFILIFYVVFSLFSNHYKIRTVSVWKQLAFHGVTCEVPVNLNILEKPPS